MEVVGHRGAAGEAPENTIAGCLHGFSRGARHLEIDLRLSADGELVVIHDKTIDRTCHGSGKVSDLTAAELGRLDARASGTPWPGRRNASIPTLKALLGRCKGFRSVQLEVKSDSHPALRAVAARLVELLPDRNASRGKYVTSSNSYVIDYLPTIAPYLKRGRVVETREDIRHTIAQGCDLCVLNWQLCTPSVVRKLHANNIAVSVWTVNDASTVKALYKMGVDSVITDYPSMALPLVAALQRKGE